MLSPLLRKTAAQPELKYRAQDHLDFALASRSPERFVEFMTENPNSIKEYDLEIPNRPAFMALLSQCKEQLRPLVDTHAKSGCIPWNLAPSEVGPGFPLDVLLSLWPSSELIDEYFGICYAPSRDGKSTFAPGAKQAIADELKKRLGSGEIVFDRMVQFGKHQDLINSGGVYVDFSSLVSCLGLDEVERAQAAAAWYRINQDVPFNELLGD